MSSEKYVIQQTTEPGGDAKVAETSDLSSIITFVESDTSKNENSSDSSDNEIDDSDPHKNYENSRTLIKSYLEKINVGDFLFNKEEEKYYIVEKIGDWKKIKNQKKKNKEISVSIKPWESKEPTKNKIKNIYIKDDNKFTVYQRIQIYYINFMNKQRSFLMKVSINWSLLIFLKVFMSMYFLPDTDITTAETNNIKKNSVTVIYKGKKYCYGTLFDIRDQKSLTPDVFNYEKDYIIIIERENIEKTLFTWNSDGDSYNFDENEVPHFVYFPYYNIQLRSILVCADVEHLRVDIYEVDKSINFNDGNSKLIKKHAKEFLEGDWKSKAKLAFTVDEKNYVTDPYSHVFDIKKSIFIPHAKAYIFVVKLASTHIYGFDTSTQGGDAYFLISKESKAVMDGIGFTKVSTFVMKDKGII